MVKTTKQNEGENGNVLTTLELNDVADKASSNNPYQATHNRRVVELQKELVRVGLVEAIEALQVVQPFSYSMLFSQLGFYILYCFHKYANVCLDSLDYKMIQ